MDIEQLIQIIPALSDVASLPLVVVSIIWLVSRFLDKQQEATMINNEQINKLIGVMSEQTTRTAELVAAVQEQSIKMGEVSSGVSDIRFKVETLLEKEDW